MALTPPPVEERRAFVRNEPPPSFAIQLLQSRRAISADGVNFSEGGLCLRLEELLEVRSLVRLQVTPGSEEESSGRHSVAPRSHRSLQCTGRVAWVIQRLDLRDSPPFLYDVGIEFIKAPPPLRRFLSQGRSETGGGKGHWVKTKAVTPCVIHGRTFTPQLERTDASLSRWHLVVMEEGVPCFSNRYPSERAAVSAWSRFKRQQGRR